MNVHSPNKTAKLFKTGGSQAVRLPAEFRFEGNEVRVRRDELTGEVILSPVLSPGKRYETWREFNEAFERAHEEFPEQFEHFMEERPLNQPLDLRDPFKDCD
jgi:antitoxin VapB